jgi:hypothetical protein
VVCHSTVSCSLHTRTRSICINAANFLIADCTTEPHGNCTDYPSKLFNHMIQQFVGFGLRAILWYQASRNLSSLGMQHKI